MISTAWTVLRWDLLAALRHRADWLMPIIFFTMIASLFPLATDIEDSVLSTFAPAVIWVAALLAGLLSLEYVFNDDFENGFLEQLMLMPHNAYLLIVVRIITHWCITGLPFTLLAPLYGYALGIPWTALPEVVISLLLGTPALSAFGTLGAALTVSLRQGGLLLALLVVPFYVPLLIFGANAIDLAMAGLPTAAPFALLGAMLILSLMLLPFAVYGALRVSLD